MDTNSSHSHPSAREALHQLRATLARMKAELELLECPHNEATTWLSITMDEALAHLALVEGVVLDHPGRGARRVFIIDDDERMARLTSARLQQLGFNSTAHTVPPASLTDRDQVVIDLSLLLGLPRRDRIAVMACQPVVVSGAVGAEAARSARQLAASAFLIKPVDYAELAQILRDQAREGIP